MSVSTGGGYGVAVVTAPHLDSAYLLAAAVRLLIMYSLSVQARVYFSADVRKCQGTVRTKV